MDFATSTRTCLVEKYADFTGRASRSEFWWFFLAYLLIYYVGGTVVGFFLAFLFGLKLSIYVAILIWIGLISPIIAATVRRIHDVDKPGWIVLMGVVPIIALALIVTLIQEGVYYQEQFGPEWVILGLVGFIGCVVVIYFLAQRGTVGPNQFGEDPLLQATLAS